MRFLREPNSIIIATSGAPDGAEVKDATIWLAVVQKSGSVPIKRGENTGKSLTYTNIVRQLTPVGLWNGKPLTIQLAQAAVMRPETEDLIVLIQETDWPHHRRRAAGSVARTLRLTREPQVMRRGRAFSANPRSAAAGRGKRRRPRARPVGCPPNR